MSAPAKMLTYDDLVAMPELGEHYELIDGVLIVPPAPSFYHGRIVLQLIRIIDAYLTPRGLGKYLYTAPVDVRLTGLRVIQPDILYVNPDRPEAFARPPAIQGAPELVVEVLSSNRHHDLVVKFDFYEQAGVREYWVADLDHETLTMFVLEEGRFVARLTDDGLARSVVLPGVTVDIAALFADPR